MYSTVMDVPNARPNIWRFKHASPERHAISSFSMGTLPSQRRCMICHHSRTWPISSYSSHNLRLVSTNPCRIKIGTTCQKWLERAWPAIFFIVGPINCGRRRRCRVHSACPAHWNMMAFSCCRTVKLHRARHAEEINFCESRRISIYI